MDSSTTSTPTAADMAAPSTSAAPVAGSPSKAPYRVGVGDVVLVRIDVEIRRPLVVAAVHPDGSVSGALICAADDHLREVFRGWESHDGARIVGRPQRNNPLAYGELLHAGTGLGEWLPRPAQLPSGGR